MNGRLSRTMLGETTIAIGGARTVTISIASSRARVPSAGWYRHETGVLLARSYSDGGKAPEPNSLQSHFVSTVIRSGTSYHEPLAIRHIIMKARRARLIPEKRFSHPPARCFLRWEEPLREVARRCRFPRKTGFRRDFATELLAHPDSHNGLSNTRFDHGSGSASVDTLIWPLNRRCAVGTWGSLTATHWQCRSWRVG